MRKLCFRFGVLVFVQKFVVFFARALFGRLTYGSRGAEAFLVLKASLLRDGLTRRVLAVEFFFLSLEHTQYLSLIHI